MKIDPQRVEYFAKRFLRYDASQETLTGVLEFTEALSKEINDLTPAQPKTIPAQLIEAFYTQLKQSPHTAKFNELNWLQAGVTFTELLLQGK